MAEKQNIPEIRFEGFTDPWEQRKLGEVAHRVIRKNEGNQSDLPLTISAQHGLVDQRDYFNNQVASRDMSGYYLLENGEFAYNKSTSGDSPWGAIKRLTKYEKGCLSTLYICFGLNLGDPDFLVTYYETNRWHGAVQMIAAEGARNHGLLNIAPDDFFETVLTLPCSTEEQKQIGCFFTQLNSLITLHQRKYDKLCTVKKSMLDKMFPKPGETEPEIRFEGFTDPWEQRKLGELLLFQNGFNGSSESFGSGIPLISVMDVLDDNFITHETVRGKARLNCEEASRYCVEYGDVLFQRSSENQEDAGTSNVYLDQHVSSAFGGFVIRGKKVGEYNPIFIKYLLGSPFIREQITHRAQGAQHINVSQDTLADVVLLMPSMREQEAVGLVFLHLDNLITLHQRKLELLRNIKKSLLDRMFV